MCSISNHTYFILSQTTLLSIEKQRGEESCCAACFYFQFTHNPGEGSPTPHSFINYLYLLRKRDVLRCEVSMADCWVDLQVSIMAENTHLAQPTVLSIVLGSYFREVSISDCWESFFQPDPRSIFHPLFSCKIIIRHNPQLCPLE